ncbi:hypothetical protein [Lacihabitans soyangensis]|uniref:Uncharacterized protein n=1 Tax=Lacihabitans soyangensis TaxID=869394 RepID=A0AAE3H5C6_9BACT|nr:hypothetical protein [Lacihabitans soyangensis]MCP9764292.1 hypothetical protein [Lacihabitans soyangensis]MCP9764293.1 hypothetical protein [Lacihabitans soyangensis]MCP9764296.1 hypothetical protein [Lacihabitans soyangensis]MCP9765637.1 hypothetical protein [Lacihabitans soyangensis]
MQNIEAQWRRNFAKSELVIGGRFQPLRAKALLYGDKNESHSVFQKGYKKFYESHQFPKTDNSVWYLIQFLGKIGIQIKFDYLNKFILQEPENYLEIKKRIFFLLKSFSDADEQLDVNDPFTNNRGDIYYFLKIATPKFNQETIFQKVRYRLNKMFRLT